MADTPLINGHKYSWASASMNIDAVDQDDFVEVNHNWKTDRGMVRGKGPRVKGLTRGEDSVEGDITLNKAAWPKLLKALKDKYGSIPKASFTITLNYEESGEGDIITEELIGCRIAGGETGVKQGTDGLTVKVPLNIMRYKINGIDPQED